jgi:hypothetical protein
VTFPKRSLPWLFTNAALGGLKPAPANRLRGARPHLLCSYAHFIQSALVAHYIEKLPTITLNEKIADTKWHKVFQKMMSYGYFASKIHASIKADAFM